MKNQTPDFDQPDLISKWTLILIGPLGLFCWIYLFAGGWIYRLF